jgi:molybdenum cofactor cytidylyltransferase
MTKSSRASLDCILLASGFSRRFPAGNKLLYQYNGKALAAYALQLASDAEFFSRRFFVTGCEEVAALAAPFSNIVTLHNGHPERGVSESVKIGVRESGAGFYLFLPCDQPLLDLVTLKKIAAAAEHGKIVRPVYNGQYGAPCVFSSCFREELLRLEGDEGGKQIICAHGDRVKELQLDNAAVLQDIDFIGDIT